MVNASVDNLILDRGKGKIYAGLSYTLERDHDQRFRYYEGMIKKIDLGNFSVEKTLPLPGGDGIEYIVDVGRFGFNSYLTENSKYLYMPCIGTYPPGKGVILRLDTDLF